MNSKGCSVERKLIETNEAPKPVGPYSQAVIGNGFVWVSMQLPLDPDTEQLVDGPIEEQARRALENVRTILYAAGSSLSEAMKVTVYFVDLDDFERFNRVYNEFFGEARPARAALQASALPKGARIAVDAVAMVRADA